MALTPEAYAKARDLCAAWDKDGDGAINRQELAEVLKQIYPTCTPQDVDSVLTSVDLNNDGIIQFEEFLRWLQLPPSERLGFADNLRQCIADDVNKPSSPVARPGAGAPASGGLDVEGASSFLEDFTHPTLPSVGLITSMDAPLPPGKQFVSVVLSSSLNASAEKPATQLLQKGDGSFWMKTTSAISPSRSDTPEELIWGRIEALARSYRCIFDTFCESQDFPAGSSLRCPLLPLVDLYGRAMTYSALVFWSGLAVAFLRLTLAQQEKLQRSNLQVCVDQPLLDSYKAALAVKDGALKAFPAPPDAGRVEMKYGNFDWIRKENDGHSRLQRLHAFMVSQRALWSGGYEAHGRRVPLVSVGQMLQSTRLVYPSKALGPANGLKLQTNAELGLSGAAMAVGQTLCKDGAKVAAVSAASAYQAGGGASSGGRHALEEAWCVTSTLYRSLETANAAHAKNTEGEVYADFRQHVPTTGCILSPAVEIFRKMTSEGYEMLPAPVSLCCVVSVAMFNRNPSISDSPLDSPADPAAYIAQTTQKMQAVLTATAEAGATVLVMPDIGCGVFKNDPLIVGGILGSVLRSSGGGLQRVVLVSQNDAFISACRKTFANEDPRPLATSEMLADPRHRALAARYRHPGDQPCSVEDAMLALARHPEDTRPACKYGKYCHIASKEHRARFSHPETLDMLRPGGPSSIGGSPTTTAGYGSSPSAMGYPSGGRFGPSKPSGTPLPNPTYGDVPPNPGALNPGMAAATAATGKPVCRYGEGCYSKNPKHFEEFAHPWREGKETGGDKQKVFLEEKLLHEMLDSAKNGDWQSVFETLRRRPDLVNGRPPQRLFALGHYAAHQIKEEAIYQLVDKFNADVNTPTRDGQTVEKVLQEALRQSPPSTEADRLADDMLLKWVQRRAAGEKVPRPTQGYASGGPVAGAAAGAGAPTNPKASPPVSSKPGTSAPGGYVKVPYCSARRDLEGVYAELPGPGHNGCPTYQMRKSGIMKERFLFLSAKFGGWAIGETIDDQANIYAYICMRKAYAGVTSAALGEYWNVWVENALSGGLWKRDILMQVQAG
eukprot:TRINITY_DN90728_c0_g1_i1.p1 TRINITY_DN90728_c0_g1~~TRINITY_DN90728_c0_g1_i1.p1  ORF type:complete len:1062 (-),score=200.10 TRINITY_DN90728_c0_g1_i1:49-3234(-)